MIRFCSICDNMMYMVLDKASGSRLHFMCKNCSHVEEHDSAADDDLGQPRPKTVDTVDSAPVDTEGGQCVAETDYTDDSVAMQQYINPHLVHDPTLPHVDNIKCPSPVCSKSVEDPNDVIYTIVDKKNKKLIFHCCHCQHTWHVK